MKVYSLYAIACFTLVVACRKPQSAETKGYGPYDEGWGNCKSSESQLKGKAYTKIILDAYAAEGRKADLVSVQRLVCFANAESKFGEDVGSYFHGAFQMQRSTAASFCPSLDMNNKLQNARCALRIAMYGGGGFPPQGWTAWPYSNELCAQNAYKSCYDGVVAANFVTCENASATLFALAPGKKTLRVSLGAGCSATKFKVVRKAENKAVCQELSQPAANGSCEFVFSGAGGGTIAPNGASVTLDFSTLAPQFQNQQLEVVFMQNSDVMKRVELK